MNKAILVRILFCIITMGIFLYAYINKQNSITELRLHIPSAGKQLEAILQENTSLQFKIDQFENPKHLMELSTLPQFSHLKHPLVDEILTIEVP